MRLISVAVVALLLECCNLQPSPAIAAIPAASTVTDSSDDLAQLEARFKAVADKVSPAVVAISASSEADDSPAACRVTEMSSDKLQAFLSKTTRMVGTGFVIDPAGYILTNDHVIDDAEQLWITTDDRKVYPAIVVGSDPRSDLAVLKIPGRNMPIVHLGDGSAVRRGQWSIAIGNPYGLSGDGGMCLSVGVVSAVNRSLPKLSDSENRLYADLIQTTAQINPGNSGGPLLNLYGDVIGINTAVIMPQKSVNGIGFALPIDARLRGVVDHLKAGDEIVYGYLGVVVSNPSDQDRQVAGVAQQLGVMVDTIQPDSPADGQIRPGDMITRIGTCTISDSDTFVRLIGCADIRHAVTIEFVRNGKSHRFTTMLSKRQMPAEAVARCNQHLRWAGMSIIATTMAGKPGNLCVEAIAPASPFVRQGIREGSILRTVAGKSVHDVIGLQGIINDTPIEKCEIVTEPDAGTATAQLPLDR